MLIDKSTDEGYERDQNVQAIDESAHCVDALLSAGNEAFILHLRIDRDRTESCKRNAYHINDRQ